MSLTKVSEFQRTGPIDGTLCIPEYDKKGNTSNKIIGPFYKSKSY